MSNIEMIVLFTIQAIFVIGLVVKLVKDERGLQQIDAYRFPSESK